MASYLLPDSSILCMAWVKLHAAAEYYGNPEEEAQDSDPIYSLLLPMVVKIPVTTKSPDCYHW